MGGLFRSWGRSDRVVVIIRECAGTMAFAQAFIWSNYDDPDGFAEAPPRRRGPRGAGAAAAGAGLCQARAGSSPVAGAVSSTNTMSDAPPWIDTAGRGSDV